MIRYLSSSTVILRSKYVHEKREVQYFSNGSVHSFFLSVMVFHSQKTEITMIHLYYYYSTFPTKIVNDLSDESIVIRIPTILGRKFPKVLKIVV